MQNDEYEEENNGGDVALPVMMDMTVMSDVSVMTDISMSYISQLEEEVQSLCVENQQLRNALESELLTEKVLSQNVYFQQD